ncbi:hypothetical protein ABPG74_002318 [Tetrahymena malaccensis]
MFDYAKKCIESIYPSATVVGKQIPGYTGCFDIYVNGKNGTLVHSKNNGDGGLRVQNVGLVMQKIKSIVEK